MVGAGLLDGQQIAALVVMVADLLKGRWLAGIPTPGLLAVVTSETSGRRIRQVKRRSVIFKGCGGLSLYLPEDNGAPVLD